MISTRFVSMVVSVLVVAFTVAPNLLLRLPGRIKMGEPIGPLNLALLPVLTPDALHTTLEAVWKSCESLDKTLIKLSSNSERTHELANKALVRIRPVPPRCEGTPSAARQRNCPAHSESFRRAAGACGEQRAPS